MRQPWHLQSPSQSKDSCLATQRWLIGCAASDLFLKSSSSVTIPSTLYEVIHAEAPIWESTANAPFRLSLHGLHTHLDWMGPGSFGQASESRSMANRESSNEGHHNSSRRARCRASSQEKKRDKSFVGSVSTHD